MRSLSIFFLLTSIINLSCTSNKKIVSDDYYTPINAKDTIEGWFFYEANVPSKCYTRFDQIEQANNIIFFDTLIASKSIQELYKKGVFYITYSEVIDTYISENKVSLGQNKKSIQDFMSAIDYFNHATDSAYNKTLYYDESGLLTYKKIYAKFSVVNLGKTKQLIPNAENYKCCYSNQKLIANYYFIADVIDFKIY